MIDLSTLDRYRIKDGRVVAFYGSIGDDKSGAFRVPSASSGNDLLIIASSDGGWDHVSVSKPKMRLPTWTEMEQVKRLFFRDDEVAFQLHVRPNDHISLHDGCLHLWRPIGMEIPTPPARMVA
jgi:hypothetical protein